MALPLLGGTVMKFLPSIFLFVLATWFAGGLVASAAPAGPNTLRYSASTEFLASGVDDNAKGQVQVSVRERGTSDQTRFRLSVAKLDPKTSYTLLALIGDDTNYVAITNFTTGSAGRARLVYSKKGHGAHQLPEMLSELADVSAVAVANTNGEIVLSADLHGSESMKFALTSVLANSGTDPFALGCLAVAWQGGAVQFRMFAIGQSSEFTFCVNGTPVQTYPADATGYIGVGMFPITAPAPLKFREVSLRNAADQVVLQSDVR
jgi:hypothetical protein